MVIPAAVRPAVATGIASEGMAVVYQARWMETGSVDRRARECNRNALALQNRVRPAPPCAVSSNRLPVLAEPQPLVRDLHSAPPHYPREHDDRATPL